jgi:molybdopterin-guanine dinucleotide biosynthesis protein A
MPRPLAALLLEQGVCKVGAWTEQQSAIEVLFPQTEIGGKVVDPFFNINQPEEIVTAEASLTKGAI